MATGEYTFFMEKLKKFKDGLTAPPKNEDPIEGLTDSSVHNNGVFNLHERVEVENESLSIVLANRNIHGHNEDVLDLSMNNATSVSIGANNRNVSEQDNSRTNELHRISNGSQAVTVNRSLERVEDENESLSIESQFVANTSRSAVVATTQDLRNINLPSKRQAVGRPKGTVNTTIGTKRKKAIAKPSSTKDKISVPPTNQEESTLPRRSQRKIKIDAVFTNTSNIKNQITKISAPPIEASRKRQKVEKVDVVSKLPKMQKNS